MIKVYGKSYDLNTLEPLVREVGKPDGMEVSCAGEGLYRTKDGKYFLAKENGGCCCNGCFGDWRDDVIGESCDTDQPWAIPVTEQEAKDWAEYEACIDADDYLRIFGEDSSILREGKEIEEEQRRMEEEEALYY